MNKSQLIKAINSQDVVTKQEAESIVDIFFDEISTALARGDRVEIRGLCSFYVKKYKAYTGRNPKTAENVSIPPKKLPFFKMGKELKERVNSDESHGTEHSLSRTNERRSGKDRRQHDLTILMPDRRKGGDRRSK